MGTIKQTAIISLCGGIYLAVSALQAQELMVIEEQARLGGGMISDDMFWSGRFTGMDRKGPFVDAAILLDYRSEYDAEKPERWRLDARRLGLDSRSVRLDYGQQGKYSAFIYYRQMPNNLRRDVGSPYRIDNNTLTLPDTGSQNTVAQNLTRHDLGTRREQVGVGGRMNLDRRWRLSSSFHHDKKEGTKVRGFVDGFWAGTRSVLAPVPVNYETSKYNIELTNDGPRLQTRVGYHFSHFRQGSGNALHYDHLYNNDWSTAQRRTESIEPDNLFHQISGSVAYRHTPTTRLGADVAFGQMKQDDAFVSGPLDNGMTSLNGDIRTTLINLHASARPAPKLNLRTSFRYDDRDNRTPQLDNLFFASPGMVPLLGRSTRPVSYTQKRFNIEADYRLQPHTNLSVGLTRDDRKRTFDDRKDTNNTELKAGVRKRIFTNTTVRGELAASRQRGSQWERLTGPEELRKFYLADRNQISSTLYITTTPTERLQLTYRGTLAEDDYLNSELGLQDARRGMMSIDLAYFPTENFNTHMYYTFERREATQRGLRASTNTAWRGQRDDQVLSLGFGAEYHLPNRRYKIGSEINLMDSSARNVVMRDGNDPAYPIQRSRLQQLSLYGTYDIRKDIVLSMRYMYERYRESDWGTDGFGINGPGSLILLDQGPMSYQAHLIGMAVRFRF